MSLDTYLALIPTGSEWITVINGFYPLSTSMREASIIPILQMAD